MDYGFQRDEAMGAGARRIAREQLERAVDELSVDDQAIDVRVHNVRKRVKKLRGLLRLVRTSLGREVFAREDRVARDVGRRLATARRSEAILGAFDALMARHPDVVAGEVSRTLRTELARSRDHAVSALGTESHAAEARALLQQMLDQTSEWSLDRAGWSAVNSGFRKTYARARKALRAASKRPTTERLHEWRRFAKYHFYHVRLLRRVWSGQMKTLATHLEELTEMLGAEHDLDDLRMVLLESAPPPEQRESAQSLLGLIERRRDELRNDALSLGRRLFAESPKDVARRFEAYFDVWQSEDDRAPAEDAADS